MREQKRTILRYISLFSNKRNLFPLSTSERTVLFRTIIYLRTVKYTHQDDLRWFSTVNCWSNLCHYSRPHSDDLTSSSSPVSPQLYQVSSFSVVNSMTRVCIKKQTRGSQDISGWSQHLYITTSRGNVCVPDSSFCGQVIISLWIYIETFKIYFIRLALGSWMHEHVCYTWNFFACSLHVGVNVSLSSFVILRIIYLFIFDRLINISDEFILKCVRIITIITSLLTVGLVYLTKVRFILQNLKYDFDKQNLIIWFENSICMAHHWSARLNSYFSSVVQTLMMREKVDLLEGENSDSSTNMNFSWLSGSARLLWFHPSSPCLCTCFSSS